MHNLNYLDLANEALPEEIYKEGKLNDIRITYKKEIKLGEIVKCKYSFNIYNTIHNYFSSKL